jgi:hypothetical protein
VLPAGLTVVAMALLALPTRAHGRAWMAYGPALALLATLALLPGYGWPALAAAQKLPWIVAGALLVGVAVHALQRGGAWVVADGGRGRGGWPAWAAASAVWAGASVSLAPAMPSTRPAQWVAALTIGAALLAALVWAGGAARSPTVVAASRRPAAVRQRPAATDDPEPPSRVPAFAALAVAAGALALLGATGGSLLLGQLAGMVASVAGVAAAWALWRPAWPVPAAALTPLGLAALSIALALAGRVAGLPLTLLALAFGVPPLLARMAWAARRPRLALVATGVLAALPAAAALIVALTAAPTDDSGASDVPSTDPYYTPQWK